MKSPAVISCQLLLVLCVTCLSADKFTETLPSSHTYGYTLENGPNNWKSDFDSCSGQHQSPVNLENVKCIKAKLPPLEWDGHWETREDGYVMENVWHTVEVQYSGDEPGLSGGPLSGDYVLSQVHFHWGSEAGSEHSLDKKFFGMEAHLVHYKKEYGSVTNASDISDGLAVVGLFFKTQERNNSELASLVRGLSAVHEGGDTTDLQGDAMSWLEYYESDDYYTYQGSLTTPPCSEIVTWIVMKNPINIGVQQVAEFQKLQGHDGAILENVRPVQPLNGRQVFHCTSMAAGRGGAGLWVLSLLFLASKLKM